MSPGSQHGGAPGITAALAGDTMLGRGVAAALGRGAAVFAPEVVEIAREADLFVLNLECCIATGGEPWPDPDKPFFFRAPPRAVDVLAELGVDCVTLANNHALDFGRPALVETVGRLEAAGIAVAGAGRDLDEARRPAVVAARGFRLGVVGLADHPADYAAGPGIPGIAYAPLDGGVPDWVGGAIAAAAADAVLVTPHWGPNMNPRPLARIRAVARGLRAAGATLVAGHSAHVFQGVEDGVLYDLGDFVDDYATHPRLRNDLGLLFLVTLGTAGPSRIEAVPLRLDFCRTELATGADVRWIARRFHAACAELGTEVEAEDGRLLVELSP